MSKPSTAPIIFALFFPSFVTWLYFMALAAQPAAFQQAAYAVGKAIQFGFPAIWVVAIQRRRLAMPATPLRGLSVGLAFGVVIAASMMLLYYAWLGHSVLFEEAAEKIRGKVHDTGFRSVLGYLGLGVFYVAFHSLMEEYYWRWFVYRELRERVSLPLATVISSLGFMAHHVLLLAVYFGWSSPLTYLFSLCVAVGGAVWALIYDRCGSLFAPWLSHALVDAAIFAIGYDIVKDQLAQ